MKPLHIGILILVGGLGGAVIMKFALSSKPAPAPVATAQVTLPEAPVQAPSHQPAPPPVSAEPAAPAPAKPAAPSTRVITDHHSTPVRDLTPASSAPAEPQAPEAPPSPAQQPAPIPEEQPTAPPIAAESVAPPAPAPAPPTSSEPPAPAPPPSVTLKSGMVLTVRLGEKLSNDRNQAGDEFTGTLDAPLSVAGFVIAEKGARVEGRIVDAQKSGHAKKAELALELTKLTTSDGQQVAIQTETFQQGARMSGTDQAGIVAAAAGIGAVIGAIAGGGKGAAIGAGAGGAAGGGGVIATRDKAIIAHRDKLTFRLSAPVTITEQIKPDPPQCGGNASGVLPPESRIHSPTPRSPRVRTEPSNG